VVVTEAARVADEHGLDQLTLAAIAKHFGVAVPSLYKHVAGLGDVRRELSVLAVRELGQALRSAIENSHGNGFHAMASAHRTYAKSHPGRYAASLRAPTPGDGEHHAASDAVLATVFDVLKIYGLEGDELVDATRTLRAALHGFVSLEGTGAFDLPQGIDQSFERMVDALDAALQHWHTPEASAANPR